MTDENTSVVLDALRKVAGFENVSADACQIQRLGGLTNLVYRVATGGKSVIVRIPGAGTEAYIDRAVELHNARVAADTGIAPQVLWGDGDTGVMISDCIDGIETMTPALFQSRAGAADCPSKATTNSNDSKDPFQFRFELFAMIDDYLSILSGKEIDLPAGYADIVAAAQPIKQLLQDHPVPLAPCHCDPLCENFLDDGQRMWIVDFEYSGMNDPLWDLGDLSVEAGFDDAQDLAMLTAYYGHAPTAAQVGRVAIYKAMCDLLWTLWGLIQHADDNPAEDFWAYAVGRFERCKALMTNPAFDKHLAAVRG